MDCDQRHAGCHAECERYKAWKVESDARLAARAREKDKYSSPDRPKDIKQMRMGIKKWNGRAR